MWTTIAGRGLLVATTVLAWTASGGAGQLPGAGESPPASHGAETGARAASVQEVDLTIPVRGASSVALAVPGGSVEVVGWDRLEVRVRGTKPRGDSLAVTRTDRHLELRLLPDEGGSGASSTDLVIEIPRGTALELEADDAAVSIRDAGGIVSVENADGDVDIRGEVRTVTVRTISGSVRVRGAARSVLAHTATGHVTLDGIRGFAEVHTTRGDLTLTDCRLIQGNLTTVESTIHFQGAVEDGGMLRLDNYAGDVEVRLDPGTGGRFEVSTFGGEIENALGPPARNASEYAPGKELTFQVGESEARIVVGTFSGDIRLLRSRRGS